MTCTCKLCMAVPPEQRPVHKTETRAQPTLDCKICGTDTADGHTHELSGRFITEQADALERVREMLHEPLPCDVELPPATIIRRGVPLSTLLVALKARQEWSADDMQCDSPALRARPPEGEDRQVENALSEMNASQWDRERVCRAAKVASHRYGQWMPQHWLDLFMDAYEGDGL